MTDMVDTIYKWCDAILMCLCRKSVVFDIVDTRKVWWTRFLPISLGVS